MVKFKKYETLLLKDKLENAIQNCRVSYYGQKERQVHKRVEGV